MEDKDNPKRSKIVACLGLALGMVGAGLSGTSGDPIVILLTVLIFYVTIRYGFKKGVFSNTDFEE